MLQEKAKLQESLGEIYPWVQCEDPKVAMFYTLCKKWGRPPPSAKGGWRTRGIVDWNRATELLKNLSGSKWHQDSSITARMAKHAMCRCC